MAHSNPMQTDLTRSNVYESFCLFRKLSERYPPVCRVEESTGHRKFPEGSVPGSERF